jgi:hypothetical protein
VVTRRAQREVLVVERVAGRGVERVEARLELERFGAASKRRHERPAEARAQRSFVRHERRRDRVAGFEGAAAPMVDRESAHQGIV